MRERAAKAFIAEWDRQEEGDVAEYGKFLRVIRALPLETEEP